MSVNWNPKSRRYERNGKTINPKTVRGWVDSFVSKSKDRVGKLAEDFRDGKINRSAWYTGTRQAIKEMHMATSMIANGGRSQMTVKEWGQAGNLIKGQLKYLDKFNNELFNGADFNDAMVARAKMYADAGYAGYENMVRERERAAGIRRVRRLLGASKESCDGCLAAQGEYDIEDAPPIGGQDCLSRCHCYYEEVAA